MKLRSYTVLFFFTTVRVLSANFLTIHHHWNDVTVVDTACLKKKCNTLLFFIRNNVIYLYINFYQLYIFLFSFRRCHFFLRVSLKMPNLNTFFTFIFLYTIDNLRTERSCQSWDQHSQRWYQTRYLLNALRFRSSRLLFCVQDVDLYIFIFHLHATITIPIIFIKFLI